MVVVFVFVFSFGFLFYGFFKGFFPRDVFWLVSQVVCLFFMHKYVCFGVGGGLV